MTNVSKVPLAPQVRQKIRNNLLNAVSTQGRGPEVLEALLTTSEKTMLYKRLAVVILLERQWSHHRITRTLKVGMPTVVRIDRHRQQGRFLPIQRAMKRTTKKEKCDSGLTLSEAVTLFLAGGMPSIAGPRGTAHLNKLRVKKRRTVSA